MIILDTHIWVWWVDGNQRLTKQYKAWIEMSQSQGIGVSIVSCWEVAKLVEKNRLNFSCPINEWLELALAYPGVQLLNLNLPIILSIQLHHICLLIFSNILLLLLLFFFVCDMLQSI